MRPLTFSNCSKWVSSKNINSGRAKSETNHNHHSCLHVQVHLIPSFHEIVYSRHHLLRTSTPFKATGNMAPRLALLLLVTLFCHCHSAAVSLLDLPPDAKNSSDTVLYRTGISLVSPHKPSEHAVAASSSVRRHNRPGEDRDPEGVTVYESLNEVPTSHLLSIANAHSKCYAAQEKLCWRAYVCGHRCEQILLAVHSFCRKVRADDGTDITCSDGSQVGPCALDSGDDNIRWARCKKARKYNRCFARICYRKTSSSEPSLILPPEPYEDTENVSIVRYRKPMPKYELLAQRNKQSSTQSAIFK